MRHNASGRKILVEVRANPHSILKSKDSTLPTKVPIVKAVVYLGVICKCELDHIKRLSAKEWMLSNCGAGEDS